MQLNVTWCVCLSIISDCHCCLFAIPLPTVLVPIKVKLPPALHKGVWGSGHAAPRIFKLNKGEVVSFTSGSLYPRVKRAGTHLRGGSVGPRSGLVFFWWGGGEEEIYAKPLSKMGPKFLGSPARSLVTVLTELPGSICQLR